MKYIEKYYNFIVEGKIKDLGNKYKDKLDEWMFKNLESISNNSSSNLEWLIRIYLQDKGKYKENISGVNILLDVLDDYFKKYLRIKVNLPIKKRDINNIKSSDELIDIVDEYNDYDKIKNDKEVNLLDINEKWIVFIPFTYKSAEKWGWGRFCTSHDETYFEFYNIKDKSLIYVMHKFDYTKNFVLQIEPNFYTIWDYQDDNYRVYDNNELEQHIEQYYNDGFLDIEELIDKIPYVSEEDYVEHYIDFMRKKLDINNIYDVIEEALGDDVEVIEDLEDFESYINFNNIYDIKSALYGYV